MALTPKQQRFVDEYLVDLNATAAAIRAGYAAKNADVQGPRLLGKVGIAEAIAAGRAAQQERVKVTARWVLDRLRAEAEDRGEGTTQSARVRALELLGKRFDIFEPRSLIRVDVTSGGKTIEPRDSLDAADIAAAARLMAMANLRIPADGGSEPVDTGEPARQATPVPSANGHH